MSRRKIYQNIAADGQKFDCANENRVGSAYWNEGKWDNFVKPHLPEDCSGMTFVEIGANAGLFLKMAKDAGFSHAVGIEKDNSPYEAGCRYRDAIGYDYRLLKRKFGASFDIEEMPLADVTLISTFHYYLYISDWLRYLDRLIQKSRLCIIVSRDDVKRNWRAKSDRESVNHYFSKWADTGITVEPFTVKDDPSPRKLWSKSFESELRRVPIDSIWTRQGRNKSFHQGKVTRGHLYKLVDDIANDRPFDHSDTDYYRAWRVRKKGSWTEETTRRWVGEKVDMLLDIKANGVREPIIVSKKMRLFDGGHRLAMLGAMGHETVIVRVTTC